MKCACAGLRLHYLRRTPLTNPKYFAIAWAADPESASAQATQVDPATGSRAFHYRREVAAIVLRKVPILDTTIVRLYSSLLFMGFPNSLG